MAKLNAASRLREEVLKVPNTVLLIAAGRVDRVVRFNRQPQLLKKYRFDKARETSAILDDIDTPYTVLSMDKGPEIEAWNNIMREVNQSSRRDKAVPQPMAVAEDCHEEWGIGNEDVPVIELNDLLSNSVPKEEVFKVQEVPDVKKTFLRAEGHNHRGRCSKKCFEAEAK